MRQLNIQILMHVPFEGPGCIQEWIDNNGHRASYTHVYESTDFPEMETIDWVILMGGPMSVYEESTYAWLIHEKEFVRQAVAAGKVVIGICLGSQMIASALGAEVYPNTQKEIGWFDLTLTHEGSQTKLFENFDSCFPVFHWHGDTFDLPAGSRRIFSSAVTPNQAYLLNDRVLGLQFHFEATDSSISDMVEHGRDELIPSASVWTAEAIYAHTEHIPTNNKRMFSILDIFAAL